MVDKQIDTRFGPEKMSDLGDGTFARVVYDDSASGTREYNHSAATLTVVTAVSSPAVPFGQLGVRREVLFFCDFLCYVKLGTSGMPAAQLTDADLFPIPDLKMWLMRIPVGVTHFRAITEEEVRPNLRVIPVI